MGRKSSDNSPLFWVRMIAALYMSFFLLLALAVLTEAAITGLWLGPYVGSWSTLVGISALSGEWLTTLLALLNFVYGVGGGLFAKPVAAESKGDRKARHFGMAIAVALVVCSLLALGVIAMCSQTIEDRVSDLTKEQIATAIKVLGTLNVSMATGFLIGLAIPGVPGAQPAAGAAGDDQVEIK